MLNTMIYLVLNFFRIFAMLGIMKIILQKENTKYLNEGIACIGFFIVNSCTYLWLKEPIVNLTVSLIGLFAIAFIYTRKFYKILFVSIAVYMIAIIAETITVTVFSGYETIHTFNHFYDVITVLLLWLFKTILDMVFSKNIDKKLRGKWCLIIVPVLSLFVVLVYYVFSVDVELKNATLLIFLLLVNILVVLLYHNLVDYFSQKIEFDLLKQKVDIYSRQMDIIMQSEKTVRTLRHDMKHHMNEIKIQAMNGNCSEIEKYITSMQDYLENPDNLVQSGNKEIDSLLNYFLLRAKRELTTVDASVQIPEEFSHSFDVNIVISNLLENAIGAANQSSEKYLSVMIKYQQGILSIVIVNSYLKGILDNKGIWSTTKADKENHGIGISSVRKTVEKHNGTLDLQYNQNRVISEVNMYI